MPVDKEKAKKFKEGKKKMAGQGIRDKIGSMLDDIGNIFPGGDDAKEKEKKPKSAGEAFTKSLKARRYGDSNDK